MKAKYITTPIYYANDAPHIGSAYTMVVADTISRHYRNIGYPVVFQTGTDEHGEKIDKVAKSKNLNTKSFVDDISLKFKKSWLQCDFKYDTFVRTTDKEHINYVQKSLNTLYANEDIHKSKYSGLYCIGCERYLTDKELVDDLCPQHLIKPSLVEEENYFFKLTKYKDRLIQYLKSDGICYPDSFKNEVLNIAENLTEDLCISRPKERLSWGIELPFDNNYVAYVWFDALLNYVSTLQKDMSLWEDATHIIGKDILKPHLIFWPCMLMALGFELPKVKVHGFWTINNQKISKSLGNSISPEEIIVKYGSDALRYFMLKESVFGQDADFSFDKLNKIYNGELSNNIGNLVNRFITMQFNYFDGIVQPKELNNDKEILLHSVVKEPINLLTEEYAFHKALSLVLKKSEAVNKYISDTKPFTLFKDTNNTRYVGSILHNVLESIIVIANDLKPYMPNTSESMLSILSGISINPGVKINKCSLLFPKI